MDENNQEILKVVNGERWKFEVSPSGYCKLFKEREVKGGEKVWRMQLNGTSVDSCLKYVGENYRMKETPKISDLNDF